MANQIKAPINYPIIAGGKIVSGGSVLFGQPNVKPDEDNPSTLKAVYLDAALSKPAENPQGVSSDGVFDQSDTGILYGPENTVYSIVIKGANKKELSYIPEYDLSDANAAAAAQESATDAANSASSALTSKDLVEALYTDFTNRYFGAFSSDPSVDSLGNPPQEGSIYFNTVSDVFYTWDGGAWVNYFPSNPNGLLVTATGTTTPMSLADRFGEMPNAKGNGAIGDGVTDDSTSINSNTSGFYLSKGTYLASGLTLNGSMIGLDYPVIKMPTGSTLPIIMGCTVDTLYIYGVIFDGDGSSELAIDVDNIDNVILDSCIFTNFNSYVSDLGQNCNNTKTINCHAYDVNGPNVFSYKGASNVISNCTFDNCEDHAIRFGRFNSDPAVPSGQYSTVDSCAFNNIRNDAVLFELNSGRGIVSNCTGKTIRRLVKVEGSAGSDPASRVIVCNNIIEDPIAEVADAINGNDAIQLIITGNHIKGYYQGITCGNNSIVSNNILEDITDAEAIRAEGGNVIVSDNQIIGHTGSNAISCDSTANIHGNTIVSTTTGIRIAGKTMVFNNTISANIGINVRSTANSSTIELNDLSDCTTAYIDASTGTLIKGNLGADDNTVKDYDVLAGTITLERGVKGVVIDTESAAATDDLDTINGGDTYDELIITGASVSRVVTVKHNTGNIRLSGGVDFNTQSSRDVLKLYKSSASEWVEVTRSDNS